MNSLLRGGPSKSRTNEFVTTWWAFEEQDEWIRYYVVGLRRAERIRYYVAGALTVKFSTVPVIIAAFASPA